MFRPPRRRDSSIIWPGFVDAVTTLLMVLMFVLTIFTVMQSLLQQTITTQDTELDSLSTQVSELSNALGIERDRVAELGATRDLLLADKGMLERSLVRARGEIDQRVEAARLAAARREALEMLVREMRQKEVVGAQVISKMEDELSKAEAARFVDMAAIEALRARLSETDEARIAMELALEEQRKRAEDTLALLAAANSKVAQEMSKQEKRGALLAVAKSALSAEQEKTMASVHKLALLNAQIQALYKRLGSLHEVIKEAEDKEVQSLVQIESLGSRLNVALARVASEQKRRAALEEAARRRLEAENENLEKFRSEFFGQLRDLLSDREGIRIVGDRFVFSSEVLFDTGSIVLLPEGRAQIADLVSILGDVSSDIPENIDWIVRVDGHTDDVPLAPGAPYKDNWQLSQARALSVVRYMQNDLGFPPERLAAVGFGEYRPVVSGNSEVARAQNRRIEFKLTER